MRPLAVKASREAGLSAGRDGWGRHMPNFMKIGIFPETALLVRVIMSREFWSPKQIYGKAVSSCFHCSSGLR